MTERLSITTRPGPAVVPGRSLRAIELPRTGAEMIAQRNSSGAFRAGFPSGDERTGTIGLVASS